MPASPQPDLFSPSQGELFAASPAPACKPDPDLVRRRLDAILAAARAAAPLTEAFDAHSLYCASFPSLLRHLGPEEGEQYRLAFDAELQRINPA